MKRCREKEKRGIYASLEVLRQATGIKKITIVAQHTSTIIINIFAQYHRV